ncbi:hypothetical protein BpHYR1_009945 [Brachionus plicatilis]|uniref:Ig-like domain-containing protein n=1 Tax=Brachionus plicatilis TaxID=10195 RepID=A0A3M7QJE7_BRAPC|nr:hypothetical protein BpHYR1_009945 [Brachionus plicatilis]
MSIAFCVFLVCFKTILAIDYPWMYYLPYGEDVTLKPLFQNKTETILIQSCKWLTPMQIPITREGLSYDTDRYFLDTSKCELTIYNNQKDTNGIYHCIINNKYVSKAMLNVYGAPKDTLLEEYLPNIIAGSSTAGAIIAFFIITCSVYKLRYKKPKTKNTKIISTELLEAGPKNQFNNESYQADENQIVKTETGENSNFRF